MDSCLVGFHMEAFDIQTRADFFWGEGSLRILMMPLETICVLGFLSLYVILPNMVCHSLIGTCYIDEKVCKFCWAH